MKKFKLNERFFTTKRKFPLDPEHGKKLPVFDYGVSRENHRRVYVWGNLLTGALGIPYLRKNENTLKREFMSHPKRLGFAEKFPVRTVACGFGFTLFGLDTDSEHKIYGCGLNTDSQIGQHEIRHGHPLETIYFPQRIHLPVKKPQALKIEKLAAGRAHSAILTNQGLFLLGNNSYGQCGREIIPDENYFASSFINHLSKIDDKKIIDVECGQDHTLALTEDGSVFSCGWGADGQTGLGTFNNTSQFTKIRGDLDGEKVIKLSSRSDFVLALSDKNDVFGWGNAEYSQITTPNNEQQVCVPQYLKLASGLGKLQDIATGGSFCMLLNENGEVFVWGFGILGAGPKIEHSKIPILLPTTLFGRNDYQPNNKVIKIACGLSYAMAVTNLGHVYAWGRNLRSCLGLGNEKDQFFPFKVSLGAFGEEVFCGYDHSVAICKPFI